MSFPAPAATPALRQRIGWLLDSYQRLLGQPLVTGGDPWIALWNAPRVVVAHGTEVDPVFFYGNRLALQAFELDFEAFTHLPSRYSAEPLLREERAALLARVSRDGYIDDYAGVRISASGKRFRIEQATVWNLTDEQGRPAGQAATFEGWNPL
ncbi:MAG TPA: MEKHLA domain-containing protein [Rhodocyclaceae bacterium]